ncbi:MAG TPA: VOC family protein [Candidatus Limnocylindrales bacterium]|jgi:catechol 2,3-dioxygenase-like lactoylglutathione lyase family enzyme|nr:VOC family protein [Candidatus Limnocylindrales bacterium]
MEFKLEVVVIPVTDVDRAKAFYADRCGFNVDVDDSPSPAFRVVQLTPPGSGCSVTIGTGIAAMEPGSLKGLQMCVADIDAAHAQYTASGVPVTPVRHHDGTGFVDGKGGDWNSFFFFDDPDGNSWAVQESATMKAAAAG